MAKRVVEKVSEDCRAVVLLSCLSVSGHEDSFLVAMRASEAREVSAEERQKLLAFSRGSQAAEIQYFLVEPLATADIQRLMEKACRQAEIQRSENEKRRIADEKRRAKAELRRKEKRLQKLEALARQV